MKVKPIKWGINVFVLSDATNGYVYSIQIYAGRGMDSDVTTGLCSRVLLDLIEQDGLHLFTDNYYKGINTCGTVHTNRKGFLKIW